MFQPECGAKLNVCQAKKLSQITETKTFLAAIIHARLVWKASGWNPERLIGLIFFKIWISDSYDTLMATVTFATYQFLSYLQSILLSL